MNLDIITDLLLNWLVNYGYIVLIASLFIGGLGFPMPNMLLLITAGGLASSDYFNLPILVFISFTAVVLGDYSSFLIFKKINLNIDKSVKQKILVNIKYWLFLSRFLVVPLAIPTNFLSARSGMSSKMFLFVDALGELVYTFLFLGIGFIISNNIDQIVDIITNSIYLITGIILVYLAIRFRTYYLPA